MCWVCGCVGGFGENQGSGGTGREGGEGQWKGQSHRGGASGWVRVRRGMGRGKRRERLSLLTWSCATSLINVSKSPRVGGCGGNQGRGVGERARGRGPTVSKRGGKVGTKAKRQGGSHEEQHGTRPTSKRKAMLRFVSTCAPHSPTHRSTCFTWTQTEPLPCPNNPASTTPPPPPHRTRFKAPTHISTCFSWQEADSSSPTPHPPIHPKDRTHTLPHSHSPQHLFLLA